MRKEICILCNGHGIIGGVAEDTIRCDACQGRGVRIIPDNLKTMSIPKEILNQDVKEGINKMSLPEPVPFIGDNVIAPAPIVQQAQNVQAQQAFEPIVDTKNDIKLCMKIFMELNAKIKGAKTIAIINEVFTKYLDI